MRINVYVDGFNLYYGSLKGRPYKWLNLETMCGLLLTIRYFTALVKERTSSGRSWVSSTRSRWRVSGC